MANVKGVSGTAVAAAFAGGVLVWSGIRGKRVSDVMKMIISGQAGTSGKNLAGLPSANPIGGTPESVIPGGGTGHVRTFGGQISQSNAANRALAKRMAAATGWTGAQWTALDNLIGGGESGWSSTIENPSSGAAGIAQNIKGFGPGYQRGNAPQQIAWLILYIKRRYGNPVNAYNFWLSQNPHWY